MFSILCIVMSLQALSLHMYSFYKTVKLNELQLVKLCVSDLSLFFTLPLYWYCIICYVLCVVICMYTVYTVLNNLT